MQFLFTTLKKVLKLFFHIMETKMSRVGSVEWMIADYFQMFNRENTE